MGTFHINIEIGNPSGAGYRTLELVRAMREHHCPRSLEGTAWCREDTRLIIALPNSISNSIAIAQSIGIVLIIILAASAMGGEYG